MWWFRLIMVIHLVEFVKNAYSYCQKSKNHFSIEDSGSYFTGVFNRVRG